MRDDYLDWDNSNYVKFHINQKVVEDWFNDYGYTWFRRYLPRILHELNYDKSQKDDIVVLSNVMRALLQELPISDEAIEDNLIYIQQQCAKYSKWWLSNYSNKKDADKRDIIKQK